MAPPEFQRLAQVRILVHRVLEYDVDRVTPIHKILGAVSLQRDDVQVTRGEGVKRFFRKGRTAGHARFDQVDDPGLARSRIDAVQARVGLNLLGPIHAREPVQGANFHDGPPDGTARAMRRSAPSSPAVICPGTAARAFAIRSAIEWLARVVLVMLLPARHEANTHRPTGHAATGVLTAMRPDEGLDRSECAAIPHQRDSTRGDTGAAVSRGRYAERGAWQRGGSRTPNPNIFANVATQLSTSASQAPAPRLRADAWVTLAVCSSMLRACHSQHGIHAARVRHPSRLGFSRTALKRQTPPDFSRVSSCASSRCTSSS